jgi:transposase
MHSVLMLGPVVYRHVDRPERLGPLACPLCQTKQVVFHSVRHRIVEHLDAEQPTYLVLRVPKYACPNAACQRKYFTPPVAEAAPYAHTSCRLQRTSSQLYRGGKLALRDVEAHLRSVLHTGTGKSSVLRWHQADLERDYPHPTRLAFSSVLCIDEVYDSVAGKRLPVFCCVDPVANITIRIPLERANAEALAAAMRQVRALGADPSVIVSDLWTAYPEALQQVWPKARRQLCWFHVMQWVTAKLARLLKEYGQTLPQDRRTALNRLRFLLLTSPEKQARLTERQQAALATAWELIRGSVVEEALQLRNDLRAVLTTSSDGWEARHRFDRLRQTWPERFHPWTFRLGEPLPDAPTAERATGLRAYLEEIMAFFVRHFERMITYLSHPGVPRTSNHVERENRRYRQVARSRYGWKTKHGLRAMLVALQGFDSS